MAAGLTVSLCTIALNEEACLPDVLSDFSAQDYPHELIDVILVDSISTDNTLQLMQRFAAENAAGFHAVKVLSNPGKALPNGWNVLLGACMTDVVIRIDGHASIPADYVSQCVETLDRGYSVVGGPRPTAVKDPTPWRETLYLAEESAFGSSVADYRNSEGEKNVSSVFHGAYRMSVFQNVGGYDERLRRTEDNDIHYRIRQAGYVIRFNPAIHSTQYVRSSFKGMLKQKYGNGYWIGRTMYVQPKCFQIYHFAPLVFVLGIIALLLTGVLATWIPFVVCAVAYALLAVLLSVKSVRDYGAFNPTMLALPFVFFAIHVSYGWGTLVGLVSGLFRRP